MLESTFQILNQAINDPAIEVRAVAAEALARAGEKGIPVLMKMATSEDDKSLIASLKVLHVAGQPGIEIILKNIDHSNPQVRSACLDALAFKPDLAIEYRSVFVDLLKDEDQAVSQKALDALVDIAQKSPDVLQVTLEHLRVKLREEWTGLKQRENVLREAAASKKLRHLAKWQAEDMYCLQLSSILKLGKLASVSEEAKSDLLSVIDKVGPQRFKKLNLNLSTSRDCFGEVLARRIKENGTVFLKQMIDRLQSPYPEVRSRAAMAIGELGLGTEEAQGSLRKLMNDKNGDVRFQAALAYIKTGGDTAKSLQTAMDSLFNVGSEHITNDKIRLGIKLDWAIRDTVRERSAECARGFIEILKKPKLFFLKRNAYDARIFSYVRFLGPDAVPVLQQEFKNNKGRIQDFIAIALAYQGVETPGTVESLIQEFLDVNSPCLQKVTDALENVRPKDPKYVESLISALDGQNDAIKTAAVQILGKWAAWSDRALHVIEGMLNNEVYRKSAVDALEELGERGKSAAPYLIDMMMHEMDDEDEDDTRWFDWDYIQDDLKRIKPMGISVVPYLVKAINSDRENTQGLFCGLLAEYKSHAKEAIPRIQEIAMNAKKHLVRAEAIKALGKIDVA